MMDHSWHTPLGKVTLASPTPWSSSSSASSQHHSVPSSPRAPLSASTSDLHRPISISPPTSLSPVDHHYPLFDLPIGNTQGDASKVTMRCSDTNQQSTAPTPKHKYENIGMSMEELATVGKWIADTQKELKKTRGVGNLLGPPPSRLSAIIQGLSTGTFDEDKYIISRRVDQHIDRVFRNAVINDKEGKRIPSTSCNVPPVSWCSMGPPDHEAKPYMSAAPSQCGQDPKPDKPWIHPQAQPVSYSSKQPLPHPVTHPPPLFMPSLNTQRPIDPLEPLQGYVFKGKKRHKNKRRHNKNIGVQTTNLIKEQTQSNNAVEKMKDISTHPHPDTPRNEGAEELKGISDVSKTNKTTQDLKLKLKISSQASVNIPRENTTLLLPGISITPRDLPVRQSQVKNTIIEVIHKSMKEEPLSLRISSQAEDDQPDNSDKYSKELNDEASQMILSNNSNADVERSLSSVASVLQVKTNGEEDHMLHSDQKPQVEESNNNKPAIVYVIDYNEKDKHNRQQGLSNNFGVDDNNRSSDNEIESLPKVKWEEVVVEEFRDENDENIQKVLHEAEDRLCQYDLKLRILQRLEKRLRDLVQIEPTPAAVPDAQIESVPVLAQDNHQDKQCDDQTQFPPEVRTAARAVLEGLVRERLNAAALQVKDNDTEEEARGFSEEAPVSPCHSLSQDKSSSTSQMEAPSDSHQEALPESHGLEQIRTPSPSPSPPKEKASPRKLLTPQLSHEEEKASEDIATPPPSPTVKVPILDVKYQVTPSVTPGSSPGKVRKNVTPECTPTVSPLHLGNVVQQPDTPTVSPTPQQALDEDMEVHHIPTPTSSALSPTPCKPPEPESVGSLLSSLSQAMAERSVPRLLDQSTQAHMTERTPAGREDVETQVSLEDNRNFVSPETPSIICQSSADITVSSLVEVSDVTCYTVSDGEIISGATVVNTSVEEGEVALTQHLHHLTSDSAKTTAFINKTTGPNKACVQCSECQNVRSEGELELDESSEGLLSMEEHESGKDQQVTSEESQVELLQPSQIIATPVDSLQVSVVQNESYSSGDATTLSNDDLTRLRQENSQLLFRLRNFGSFSFLTQNFQSSHSSSSSSS